MGWVKIDTGAEFKRSYTRAFQGVSEPYAKFIGKLMEASQRQVNC